jgi:HD-like signal output (HDOD) protein
LFSEYAHFCRGAADMADVVPLTEVPPGVSDARRRKTLESLGKLPPFSPILNRLMASLAGDTVSFSKLGDLIEKDTVVSGNLLHLVNSAMYARRGTINSVRHALSLLGIEKVRNAVLGMSLARMWRQVEVPASWSMARFNTHSAAVAILSDLMAQRVEVSYPEGAFVAGLLHDLGRLLIATALPEIEEQIDPENRLASEAELLGFTHAELSAEALAVWNLPEPIRIAVLHHHAPVDDANARIALSWIVAAANNFVNSTGDSIDLAGDPANSDAALLEMVGFRDNARETLLNEFAAEYSVMLNFFR